LGKSKPKHFQINLKSFCQFAAVTKKNYPNGIFYFLPACLGFLPDMFSQAYQTTGYRYIFNLKQKVLQLDGEQTFFLY